jgi:hypothetical protein
MKESLFVLMSRAGHTRGMYPIDVQQLIRRGTLGSHALDPMRPHRQSRRLRVTRALAARLRDTSADSPCGASTTKTASAGG